MAVVADKPTRSATPPDEPSLVPSYMRQKSGPALPDRQASEDMRMLGRRRLRPTALLPIIAGGALVILAIGVASWMLANRNAAPLAGQIAEALPSPVVVRAATPTAASALVPLAAPLASIPPPPGRQPRDTNTVTPGPPPSIATAVLLANAITATSATPRPSPAPGDASPQMVRPNGPVIRAVPIAASGVSGVDDLRQRLLAGGAQAIPLDTPVYGGSNWGGSQDLSGTLWSGWDDTYLYLLVKVSDDIFVQESSGILLYQGDSVELQFDGDLAGDFTSRVYNDDDWQIGLSPGNLLSSNPQWQWWSYRGLPGPGAIQMAAARDSDGYSLAAAVPWTMLRVEPRAGNTFGFAVNINDNDTPGTLEQKSMVSTSPVRQLNDPTSWGTLQLAEPQR